MASREPLVLDDAGAIQRLQGGDTLTVAGNQVAHDGLDTGWIEIASASLLNGWEEYDEPVAYRKDLAGNVHIKGTVRYGALNYAVLQLPASMRPDRVIPGVVRMRGGFGAIDINTDGYVIPRGEEEYDYDTGALIEVGYLSLEVSFI